MTPRERVLTALRHEQPDYSPYCLPIDPEPLERLDRHYGGTEWRSAVVDHLVALGLDSGHEELGDGRWRDKFGVVWAQANDFHVVEIPLREPTLEGFQPPDLFGPEDLARVQQWCVQPSDLFRGFSIGFSFFERAWSLRGMDNLLMDMVEHPRFVHELMDLLLDLWLPVVDAVGRIEGLDYIQFGDDYGMQRGVIMGTPYWREYLRPRLRAAYARAHSHGKYVAIHSCGDNSPILEDLIEIGVDLFNPFQPEAQDIYEMKRRFGHRIAFWGGIGTQQLLPRGTPEQIRREVRRVKQEIGRDGGLVLSPTKPILPDVPTENAVACVEAMLEGTDSPLGG